MPGLDLVGTLIGRPQAPSPNPKDHGAEQTGMFVAGDANAMLHYSGNDLGWRWLCRAQGPMIERVSGWPQGPDGGTFGYFKTEDEARAYYGALRQHALNSVAGLVVQDTRQNFPLNVPTAYAESFWQVNQEVLRLIYDRMTDLQVMVRNTETLGIVEAWPNGPPYVGFLSDNANHYLAVAKGASGAAEHVVIVFSERHQPNPTVSEGLPRAEWMSKFDQVGITFPSNMLVVQWGRMSGRQTLAQENPNDVAGSLVGKMQGNVAMPLPHPADLAGRLDPNAATGYAVRLEPGTYNITYYELLRTQFGDFTCCAISRDGAPSFMPAVVGNAGGIVHDGLTVDQYAMLSVERDNLVMQMGPQAVFGSQMAAICQKYGMPFHSGGMAARSQGWELMIQGDPAFSAQWVVHRNIASMRLQGIEPSQEQIQAMAQQQEAVTNQLEQHAQQHEALNNTIEEAARHAIMFSSGQSPEAIFGEVRRVAPQAQPADVLYRSLKILRDPGEDGNPRYDRVDTRVDPLARAHWLSMSEDDRNFEGGDVDKYVKEQIGDIYPNNDLKVPGLMGFLNRL